MQLSLIGRQIRHDPSDAEQLVTSASGELAHSLEELRELARGIHPAALDQGLDTALDALALRSAVPTIVSCEPGTRLPEPVEFAAYLVASEALANVAKYAHATAATVRLVRTGAVAGPSTARNRLTSTATFSTGRLGSRRGWSSSTLTRRPRWAARRASSIRAWRLPMSVPRWDRPSRTTVSDPASRIVTRCIAPDPGVHASTS